MDMKIPPLIIKIMLESNPPKSIILVGRSGALHYTMLYYSMVCHIALHKYVCICVYLYTCVYIHIYIYIYCIYIYIYIYIRPRRTDEPRSAGAWDAEPIL